MIKLIKKLFCRKNSVVDFVVAEYDEGYFDTPACFRIKKEG
ncbi:hypothetical protein [Aeromonas veronii]|nr:hypothetical protein [Aeromonas veronii]